MQKKKINSLKLNFIMNAIFTLSSILFPIITFPYVSRILLPVGTGKVAFAVALISYFTLFAQLGIPTYGIRVCAKVRDDKIELSRVVHELLIINLGMCIIAYIVLIILILIIPQLYADRTLYAVVSLSIFFNSIGMEWLYKGLEQYRYITIRSIAFKFMALIGILLLVRRQSDYIVYGGLVIFATSASNLLNFIHAHQYIAMRPVGNYCFRRHIKAIAMFFCMSCATTIYTHIDAVMLGGIVGNVEVGYYDAAVKVRSALLSIVTALGTVLLPRSSYYINKNMIDRFRTISVKAMDFVLVTSIPLTAYFIFFAPFVINVISGPAYNYAIVPLRIIMPTIIFVGITNIFGIQMLVPLGREREVLYSEIAGAITDVIINFMLIPFFGAIGAAIGTLIAEVIVFIVQYLELGNMANEMMEHICFLKIFFALIISGALSLIIYFINRDKFFWYILSSILFFLIYGSVLLLMRESFVVEITGQLLNIVRKKK